MKTINWRSVLVLISLLFPPETYAKPYFPFNPKWDDTIFASAFDPGNRRGHNPVYKASGVASALGTLRQSLEDDGGAGSANFQFTVPVLNLVGRGLDLSLALHYNSRVWHKVEYDSGIPDAPKKKKMIFDIDSDWPAPGWSLGFGKLVQGINDAMLVDADGTRHPFTQSPVTQAFHTTDSTLIDYRWTRRTSSNAASAVVQYPDGKVIDFTASDSSNSTLYPTKITDANGNFITITYRDNVGPRINTITDTLGRVIRFYYDNNERLTAVEEPGLGGANRTLLRLHYRNLKVNYAFSLEVDKESVPSAFDTVDAIYYPGTQTGYWFGDIDSFSPYGMLRKITERRGMELNASSLTVQGTINPGVITRERLYNYPTYLEPTLTDAPIYDKMTDTWEGMDTPPAVTSYINNNNANPRRTEVIYPDGSHNIQVSFNNPGQFNDGLVYETYSVDRGNANILNKKIVQWEKGEYGAPRVQRIEEDDGRNKPTAVEYSYNSAHNGVTELRKYDYGTDSAAVLRRVETEYVSDPGYEIRHIYNLPKATQIFQGAALTPVSRTEYFYDNGTLADTPGIVSHWDSFSNKGANIRYRGNLTSIKRYADAAKLTGAISDSRSYDVAGNLIAISKAPGEQTRFGYTVETQYAYPSTVTFGAVDPNSPAKLKTSSTYDFNTGLIRTTTDANGRITKFNYFADTLLPESVVSSAGAKTVYEYDFSGLANTQTVYNSSGGVAAKSRSRMNGIGLVRHAEALANGNKLDIVETKYDVLRRPWQQSRPFREGQTPQWSETSYDALGRVTAVKAADGSTSRYYYNESNRPSEASDSPGQTTRLVDPWGRARWLRTNALGQLEEVVEPNPDGGGSFAEPNQVKTIYKYNAFDQTISVSRKDQRRSFNYDSLGRLTHQYLPEKRQTLDRIGSSHSPLRLWSDVFVYDEHSNLASHIDARGVKTDYQYDNDPLNRLHGVTYNLARFSDTGNPVTPAPPVTYEYMQTGDVTRVSRVITAGISTTENAYQDTEGRLSSTTITFDSRPSYPLTVGYSYDDLGKLSDITYPLQYPATNLAAKTLHFDFGQASQLKSVTMSGSSYASDFIYNAAGQLTSLNIGAAGSGQIAENRYFDPVTGLMTGQRVSRSGTPLLDLAYGYEYSSPFSGTTERTGQLTRMVNNLDRSKDQIFNYDAWGRLQSVQSGQLATTPYPNNPGYDWRQEYKYDDYGNRTSVKALGPLPPHRPCPLDNPGCKNPLPPELPAAMRDGLGTVSYDAKTNRINLPGFKYDAAGNLMRGLRVDGTWQTYQYDAAGRLAGVFDEDGVNAVELYTYDGATNKRLITRSGQDLTNTKYYAWGGSTVIAEYDGYDPRSRDDPKPQIDSTWTRSYVYLGERLLATLAPEPNGTESVQFHHPGRLGTRLITDPSSTGMVGVPGNMANDIAAARRSDGGVDVVMIGKDYTLWPNRQSPEGIWTGFNERIGSVADKAKSVALTLLPDGRMDVYIVGKVDENMRHSIQESNGKWSSFEMVGAPGNKAIDIAAARRSDGGVDVVMIGKDYTLWPNRQKPDGTWTGFNERIGSVADKAKSVALTHLPNGRMDVYMVKLDGNMQHAIQKPEGGWNVFEPVGLPGKQATNIAAARRPDGGVDAVMIDLDGNLWHNRQKPDGTWIGFNERIGSVSDEATSIALAPYPDGRSDVYWVDSNDGNMWHSSTPISQETFAFGTEMPGVSSGSNRLFTSYDRSALTKLDYAVNRYYDAYLGRFTQVDPLGMGAVSLRDPQSLNMYAYVGNDPVNGIDPNGLMYDLHPNFRVCVLGQCSDGGGYGSGGISSDFFPSIAELNRECNKGGGVYNSCVGLFGASEAKRRWDNQQAAYSRWSQWFDEALSLLWVANEMEGLQPPHSANASASDSIGLAESICRGLRPGTNCTPTARPFTDLDKVTGAWALLPPMAIASTWTGLELAALETSEAAIGLSFRAMNAATSIPYIRVILVSLMPYTGRQIFSDPSLFRTMGFSESEILVMQALIMAKRTYFKSNGM